jgi:hypothetical protein
MEKNLITQRLELIENLLRRAESKEEALFLLGMREALKPFRFLLNFIELKGGNHEN